jgi:peptide/nickel transport system permease protein
MVRRLLSTAWSLLVVLAFSFVLIRTSGDPARSILGPYASADAVRAVHRELGLDKPLYHQFADYVWNALQGDLGTSIRYGSSNASLIGHAFGESFKLVLPALALGVLVGLGLGITAAIYRNSVVDRMVSGLAMITQALPVFWFGMILVLIFAVSLHVLPASGDTGVKSIILPAAAMSLTPMGQVARVTRISFVQTLDADYVTALRSLNVSRRSIYLKHGLKNAALPIITVIGLMTGTLIASDVSIGFLFSWPNLGSLLLNAINVRDLGLVEAVVLVIALAFLLVNLLVDLAYPLIDPRIRAGMSRDSRS